MTTTRRGFDDFTLYHLQIVSESRKNDINISDDTNSNINEGKFQPQWNNTHHYFLSI